MGSGALCRGMGGRCGIGLSCIGCGAWRLSLLRRGRGGGFGLVGGERWDLELVLDLDLGLGMRLRRGRGGGMVLLGLSVDVDVNANVQVGLGVGSR